MEIVSNVENPSGTDIDRIEQQRQMLWVSHSVKLLSYVKKEPQWVTPDNVPFGDVVIYHEYTQAVSKSCHQHKTYRESQRALERRHSRSK